MQAPTAWADPPSMWSNTSVCEVEVCPRRWQLLRSHWGDIGRFPERPNAAAIEGQIIHSALDRLTRACGQRGNPSIGSPSFSAALIDADFFSGITRDVDEWRQRLKSHPRPGPAFRLREGADDLANRAVRMFREQYKPDAQAVSRLAERVDETQIDLATLLKRRGALSEIKLTHPSLPFIGIIDRVQIMGEGLEIIDFKTGKPSEDHRRQLLRYALLWWRTTGDVPTRAIAQYLDGIGSWPVTASVLEDIEAELVTLLPLHREALSAHPAPAKPSRVCTFCPVRARCTVGWTVAEEAALADGRGDAELVVEAKTGEYGFLARTRYGADVAVVYEAAVSRLIPGCTEGRVIRVLSGVWKEGRSQLELKAWTEVFVVHPDAEA